MSKACRSEHLGTIHASFCEDQEVEGGQVESIKDELLGAGDVVLVEVGPRHR